MVTHAFFKALLFLGSGSVIHGMHHEQDMRKMGALRKLMPVTAGTFIIGWLAIAGVPPFAGFWSKDEILLSAWSHPTNTGLYRVLWGVALVTALLTAFYMTRQVIMVFFGKARWEDHSEEHGAHGDFKPHESPAIMLLPLVALCGLSIVGGVLNLPFTESTKRLLTWLEPVIHFGEIEGHSSSAVKWGLAVGTAALCIASMGVAYLVYQRNKIKAIEPQILADGWRYDRLISWFMGKPGRQAFEATSWADRTIVDGAVNGVATVVRRSGGVIRRTQSGFVRNYALLIGGGVVLMLAWFFLRAVGVFG
jgi:NADH-quinone oxidoreductase subunit L